MIFFLLFMRHYCLIFTPAIIIILLLIYDLHFVNQLILKDFYSISLLNSTSAQILMIQNIKKTIELAKKMLDLGDEGDAVREDTNCVLLYSVLRGSGYRIKQLAEAEREAHIKKAWWKD